VFELSVYLRSKLIGRSAFTIDEVRIGRSADNEVQIDNVALSRYHASIERMGDVHVLKDFGSHNGTFLNGDPVIGRRALNDGDQIGVGKYKLLYQLPSSGRAAMEVRDVAAYAVAGETDLTILLPEARERPCPFVAVLEEPAAGREPPRVHPLLQDIFVLGSSEGACDLVLADAPPRAAAVIRGWRGFQLLALGPSVRRNGAEVVDRAELSNDDELVVGGARFRYRVGRSDLVP
jgi:hypothetical protein